MAASETILWGAWVDYSQRGTGAPSYGGGGAITGTDALSIFEANVGKQCSLVHVSGRWMDSGATHPFSTYTTNLNILTAAGRLPFMEWCPFDLADPTNDLSLNLANIIAGNWDSYITTFATDVKAWGKPLIIRMFIEPNLLGQFPWQYGNTGSGSVTFGGHTWTNTNAQMIAAWQRIVNIFKVTVGCLNAKFVWCPNIQNTSATITFATQYPGSQFVDVLGMDGYTSSTNGTQLDMAAIFRGGGSTGLQDTYALISALDPALPMMICETGWFGTVGSPVAVTSIVRTGGSWAITTASALDAATVPGCSLDIAGTVPSAYRGEWVVASGSGTSWVVNGDSDHGAITTVGTVQTIDRVNRAINVKKSLEIDLPAMPRVKFLALFYTAYSASQWCMDYDGTQPLNIDMLALRAAIGNAHYLAGGNMGTDVSTLAFVPFQDQALIATGARERYRAVFHSTLGLVGAWLLRDAFSTTPVLDDSGNGRTGVVNGAAGLGAANVIPAQPTWTSAIFTGVATANITIADNNAFSPVTTGQLSIEVSFVLAATPAGTSVIVSKGSPSNFEWSIFVNATQVACTLFQIPSGSTYATNAFTLPSINVPHHLIATIDTTNTAAPLHFYLDGAPHTGGAAVGTMSNGTAPVVIGARGDLTQPLVASSRVGPLLIYNTVLSAESVADHYAAWIAGPALTAGPVAA